MLSPMLEYSPWYLGMDTSVFHFQTLMRPPRVTNEAHRKTGCKKCSWLGNSSLVPSVAVHGFLFCEKIKSELVHVFLHYYFTVGLGMIQIVFDWKKDTQVGLEINVICNIKPCGQLVLQHKAPTHPVKTIWEPCRILSWESYSTFSKHQDG